MLKYNVRFLFAVSRFFSNSKVKIVSICPHLLLMAKKGSFSVGYLHFEFFVYNSLSDNSFEK